MVGYAVQTAVNGGSELLIFVREWLTVLSVVVIRRWSSGQVSAETYAPGLGILDLSPGRRRHQRA